MSQPILLEKAPRGAGLQLAGSVYILTAPGNPNDRTDLFLTQQTNAGADTISLGTLYIDSQGAQLYIKTGPVLPGTAPSGTWTAIS